MSWTRVVMVAGLLFVSGGVAARSLSEAGIKSLAVMPINARGKVAAELTQTLDDLVLSALQKSASGVRVIGKADIDAQLGLEKMKDALGCTESACAAELAGALGVDGVVAVSLGTLGKKHLLSLSVIVSRTSEVFGRHSENLGTDIETFDTGVEKAVQALLGIKTEKVADVPPLVPKPGASCSKQGTLRSVSADRPLSMLFRNQRRVPVQLFWLDYSGAKKSYGVLQPGDAMPMDTFFTHPWLLADMDGVCQSIVLPESSSGTVDITDVMP